MQRAVGLIWIVFWSAAGNIFSQKCIFQFRKLILLNKEESGQNFFVEKFEIFFKRRHWIKFKMNWISGQRYKGYIFGGHPKNLDFLRKHFFQTFCRLFDVKIFSFDGDRTCVTIIKVAFEGLPKDHSDCPTKFLTMG